MSGAPGAPTDVTVEVRPGGGFALTWDRPDPYYPDNGNYRPVRGKNKKPILDENGQTVPQFRYDVEYKRADGQTGGWCSQSKYRDLGLGNNTLSSDDLHAEITSFCGDAEPIVGEGYNFRNRAAYVWLKSGDTNVRNGPWTYSGSVSYNPIGGPPDIPTGVKAVGCGRQAPGFGAGSSSLATTDLSRCRWRR